MKDKFNILTQTQKSKDQSPQFKELRKSDLFDLGALLIIAATGGLEVLSEDFFSALSS
jgi:hypothetical protein